MKRFPPKMVFGMRAPNKQEQVYFVVPSRFDVANFTHDARVNFRTLRYYCGMLQLRLNSAQERYNMIQPDGTVVPISAGMVDLVEKVIGANPRVFSARRSLALRQINRRRRRRKLPPTKNANSNCCGNSSRLIRPPKVRTNRGFPSSFLHQISPTLTWTQRQDSPAASCPPNPSFP